ncbi:MAG: NosD domain-containing protein [Gemmatimonadales bacterium]
MRRLPLLAVLIAAPVSAPISAQSVPYTPGMIVTHSVRIHPGQYLAPAGDSAALTIRGLNVTVDLTGVELVGNSDREHPDQFAGTAVRIDGGRNITVKGVHARGYKVGIIARGVTHLSLLNNDLSYNWRPRLYSGIVKESLIDWLDYHQNEKDEWLRYGAGIYLSDVTIGEIKGNTVVQGMNGLLMASSTGVRVWNNTFSFNSGLGIGLYRASHNVIMHNRVDWNVRGYSHGFYNRGQDSAGLLMYEQSSNNIVAYNSVTHSGDGLFLWAGQSTMDTGQGGANDNLFYHNDFSYAPTNGMEATFSRNAFVDNRVVGNWHGLWGGYSYESVVLGNQFQDNVEAIAIEHGHDNRIVGNTFAGDTVAIHLWWNRIEPSDWGFPKYRDTRSRDYIILGNTFSDTHVGLRVDNTLRLRADGNAFHRVDTVTRVTGDTTGWSFTASAVAAMSQKIPARYRVVPLRGGINALMAAMARRGRAAIIVDSWGSYDWRSPKLWPVGRDDSNPLRLRVLGPTGRWQVVARDGIASISADAGRIGDTLTIKPAPGREGDYSITLEYLGSAVVTPFGDRIAAGTPIRFGWHRFQPAATWHLRFVPWDSTRTRRTDATAIAAALQSVPVATLDTNRLDLSWYDPPRKAIPQANVLTEATAQVPLARGRYLVRTIADDAIRVYVDDKLVIDDWNPGESHVKEATFTATGNDRFRVEHLQIDGWYELRLDIERAR